MDTVLNYDVGIVCHYYHKSENIGVFCMDKIPKGQQACIDACKDWKQLKRRNKVYLARKYGGSESSWKNRM